MSARTLGLFLILSLASAACASIIAPKVASEPAALKPGAYALDPHHAAVLFKVNHLGYANYVGRFEKLEATLDFDAADPELSHVEARIDIASLDVGNDEFAATLAGPDWLDAGRFPEAVFRSTRIETIAGNAGRMIGDLTLHGVTSPVAFDVTFNGGAADFLRGGYVVGFSAKGEFSRKAFGVDRFDSVVGDKVVIEIEAEFVRR
ncbi:MAG: YceI family protein [Parvularculaceae bacterium]|nr:YceI family protein [Parvularculaceae bacterium]